MIIRWEYKIIPLGESIEPFKDNVLIMDAMGAIGWELVIVYERHMVFKRHAQAE
jgi:hypothetical protein